MSALLKAPTSIKFHALATLIKDGLTVLADQHGSPLLNRKEGDEKQAQIVINPAQIDLYTSTRRACFRLLADRNGFGLNAPDYEIHQNFPFGGSASGLYKGFLSVSRSPTLAHLPILFLYTKVTNINLRQSFNPYSDEPDRSRCCIRYGTIGECPES